MKVALKAGLQVLAFLTAVIAVMALEAIPTRALLGDSESVEARLSILVMGIHFITAVAVVSALVRWRAPSSTVTRGWPNFPVGARWFGAWTLLGMLPVAVSLGFVWAMGGGRFEVQQGQAPAYIAYILPLVGALVVAALAEEWTFRGYPLTKLAAVFGPRKATAVVAIFFALAHWGGSGWNALVILNLVVFSLILGELRFTKGGIPAAWGFHFGWNSMHALAGATLTAARFAIPWIRFEGCGVAWLSGGKFGLEGSVGTTLASVVVLILLVRRCGVQSRACRQGQGDASPP